MIIFKHKNRLSSSCMARVDPGVKFIDGCLTLAKRTGKRNDLMASCIYKITF